jgi:hypothetical protein
MMRQHQRRASKDALALCNARRCDEDQSTLDKAGNGKVIPPFTAFADDHSIPSN